MLNKNLHRDESKVKQALEEMKRQGAKLDENSERAVQAVLEVYGAKVGEKVYMKEGELVSFEKPRFTVVNKSRARKVGDRLINDPNTAGELLRKLSIRSPETKEAREIKLKDGSIVIQIRQLG